MPTLTLSPSQTSILPPEKLGQLEQGARKRGDTGLRYRQFRQRYRNDRVAFVHDCFDWDDGEAPAPYQDEILSYFDTMDRVAVYGPRSLGKTAIEGWLGLHTALCMDDDPRRDWKMMVTAGAWGQLEEYLWPEIHKWSGRLHWAKVGRPAFNERTELLSTSLRLKKGHIYSVSPQKSLFIEGGHADFFFNLFDEAKAVEAAVFDGAEGATFGAGAETKQKAKFAALSTPGDTMGRFYEICSHAPGLEDWKVRHVTLDECLAAGRIAREKVEARARQWGVDSQLYRNHVLGEFAPQDADGIIPLDWVEKAVERGREWRKNLQLGLVERERITVLGCDIADSGKDDNCFAPRCGNKILDLRYPEKLSKIANDGVSQTMATCGEIVKIAEANGGKTDGPTLIVDANGVGAGVASRLKEQGYPVHSWIDAEKPPTEKDLYGEEKPGNKRSWAWLAARWMLDPDNKQDVCLPDDPRLIGELVIPRRKPIMSDGRVFVESKDEIRKRNSGKSTDAADPIIMALTVDRGVKKKRDSAGCL